MRRVLELGGIRGEDDVAQERDFGMAPSRAVDRANDRHLDVQQIHQQMPALPMDAFDPLDRRTGRKGGGAGRRPRPRELLAGPGQDHDAVLTVAADVVEGLGQLAVRQKPPAKRLPFGMQRYLENAVAALHSRRLVLVSVVLEGTHFYLPRGRYRFLNLSRVTISAACRCGSTRSSAGVFAGNGGVPVGFAAAASNRRTKLTDGSA